MMRVEQCEQLQVGLLFSQQQPIKKMPHHHVKQVLLHCQAQLNAELSSSLLIVTASNLMRLIGSH
jgi:hypothetical protein